jgi:hypothetical protein
VETQMRCRRCRICTLDKSSSLLDNGRIFFFSCRLWDWYSHRRLFFIHAVPASARSCNGGKSRCAIATVAFYGVSVCCIAVHAHRLTPAVAAGEKRGKMAAIMSVHGVASIAEKCRFVTAIGNSSISLAHRQEPLPFSCSQISGNPPIPSNRLAMVASRS